MDDDKPRLAGQSVLDLRWAFEELLGAERVAAAIARVPEGPRREYVATKSIDWLAYSTIVAVHDELAKEAGEPIEALLERAVPLAVERSFKTVWRLLLRFSTDATLIARTPLLYSKTRSKGAMSARVDGPGRATTEVTGWPGMPPRDVRALGVSIRALLTLAGRKEVVVDEAPTPDGARYSIRWGPQGS